MNKTIKKITILAIVFLAAIGVYIIISLKNMNQSQTVYTAMDPPTLPVVYTDLFGTERNRLTAYRKEMDPDVAREALTILPQDRQLKVYCDGYGVHPTKITYEIRSLDQEQLVEKTELEAWDTQGDEDIVILPIQNLLLPGKEYLLHIMLETEPHGTVHYYTRALFPENEYGQPMAELARNFSTKTLSEREAAELVTYLETTSTADNSSLGNVTIKSSFSQLTWAGLKMELAGEMQVNMRELDGIMGQVEVSYQVRRTAENGEEELYDVSDYYTMKWSEKRIYLMDFNRITNQVFSGQPELFSGRRILLGIGNDDVVSQAKSDNGQYQAFVFNRDLWCYDQGEKQAEKIFSFRDIHDTSGRSSIRQHGIKILSVEDNGNVEFLVYGYMNRGNHEGYQGIGLYGYSRDGNVAERFFIPSTKSFDRIEQEVELLSFYNGNGMLYLYQDCGVLGIDLHSKEYIVVADNLTDGRFVISEDKSRLAWQEEGSAEGLDTIHIFDLSSGNKQEIKTKDGSVLRILGFVQRDLVYGLARPDEMWVMNGRNEELPMYALEIIDEGLEIQTRYERDGYYIANAFVEDARIHVDRLVKLDQHQFVYHDSDTIVCNEPSDKTYMEGIGWYASETRRKLYFIQLAQEIRSGDRVKVTMSRELTYDQSEELHLDAGYQNPGMLFYAYGRGKLQGIYTDFSDALRAAYEVMGFVTDGKQRILWDRVDRDSIRNIREPLSASGELLMNIEGLEKGKQIGEDLFILDARSCTLSQILYFIGQGIPVVAYAEGESYLLLSGYDQYNVTIYNPLTGESGKMGLNDANEYFNRYRNDFICGIRVK